MYLPNGRLYTYISFIFHISRIIKQTIITKMTSTKKIWCFISAVTKLTPPPPRVVNPLSVSIDSSGKKCLILHLRYINMHLYHDKIKLDNWKFFKNYLLTNKGSLFKFDLKKWLSYY